jgi:hypothetical protein
VAAWVPDHHPLWKGLDLARIELRLNWGKINALICLFIIDPAYIA